MSSLDLGKIQGQHLLSLRSLTRPFWLDSNDDSPLSASSFASAGPSEILEVYHDRVVLFVGGASQIIRRDPFIALEEFVTRAVRESKPSRRPRPVCVGYLSYDLGALTQRLPLPQHQALPLLYMARYDTVYAEARSGNAGLLLGAEGAELRHALIHPKALPPLPPLRAQLEITEEQYKQRFARVREHIYAGDIYQANISIGLTTPFTGEPLSLYQRLREVARVPFGAFIDDGHGAILSASMERFLRGEKTEHGYLLETRPIKGTRPRSEDPLEDQAQREELGRAEKDRAEHVMIVDLERNDLGRVAQGGGVTVAELCAVHAHQTVFHMESTVKAVCRPQVGISEIFRAMFPTGSITGAPKRRAMEIIAQIEGAPRGVYCGAIGYFDDHGGFDFSVAIRTAELRGGVLQYRAGGGLVADSDAALEWQECNWKAAAFVKTLSG